MAAEMNVSMLLTLVDRASPGVRAFTSLLTSLESVVNNVNAKLNTLDSLLARTGAAARNAATGLRDVNTTSASTNSQLNALNRTVAATLGHVNQLANGLMNVAVAMRTVNNVGNQGLGQGLGHANNQANQLLGTVRGIAQLWAAMEIKKGLVSSADKAMQYEDTRSRLKVMGMSPAEQQLMINASLAASAARPQFNQNQALDWAIDLRSVTGDIGSATKLLIPFLTAAYNMKAATPHGMTFNDRDMLDIAKALDQRGATLDPKRFQDELNMIEKIYSASQGRIDAKQILGNLQYAKGGLGQTLDIEFLPFMAAMMDQMKAGGGNGGPIGTMLTTLARSVVNGVGSGSAQKLRAEAGLLDPDKLVWNKMGNIDQRKSQLKMAGAELFQTRPDEWVEQYLKPALVRLGVDLKNEAQVAQMLVRLFPDRNANTPAIMMVNQGEQLRRDVLLTNQTKSGKEAYDINVERTRAALDAMKAQFENLLMTLGASLLPAVEALAKLLTSMFISMNNFFKENPGAATAATWILAISSIALGIAGLRALFPIFGFLTTGFGGLGTVLTFIGGLLARLIPVVTLFFAAWGVWKLVTDFEGSIKKIQDWVKQGINFFVDYHMSAMRTVIDFAKKAADLFKTPANASRVSSGIVRDEQGNPVAGAYSPHGGQQGLPVGVTPSTAGAGRGSYAGFNPPTKPVPGSGLNPPGTPPDGVSSRFKYFDPELDAFKNQLKLQEDEQKRHQEQMDLLYKKEKISINAYYDDKLRTITTSNLAEIDLLKKEREEYRKNGDKAGVNKTNTEILKKTRELMDAPGAIELQREADLLKLKKEALAIDEQIAVSEERKADARARSRIAKLEEDRKGFLVNNQLDNVAKVDAAIAIARADAELEKFSAAVHKVQDEFRFKEQEIQNELRLNMIGPLEAEQQMYELRQKEVVQLDALIAKLRAYIEANNAIPQEQKDKILLELNKQSQANAGKSDPLNPEMRSLANATRTEMGAMFSSILNGTEKAGSALEKFFQNMKKRFLDMIGQKLGDKLFESLFGGGKKGSSGGGLLDFLFKWMAGGSSGASPTAGNAASIDAASSAEVGWYASGIDEVPNDMLAVIHKGERVVTASDNVGYTSFLDSMNNRNNGGSAAPYQLTVHPDAINMTLRQWLEGEVTRQSFNRG